ncbi:Inherit from COG: Uncharacterized protein conserved in bacteria (DUF2064) [Seminavis robusta]|uniref:Inherit from COG: Uncharacterized protein conserved in bacteria (DUF2064) n=1 Tax=Seminavis robusta TaxID=568900 RepID=A0A9N8DK86_9STRA|nr:Inherit from COG: Uncharacterized protein conserved in bacteria (DUF2064) [Seminavis robusta]|eukprot:Sro174_g076610.1 Inherit from COG: Uncharacterized protein conserved in bacteria (DUF2064) (436) ;mRNA; r:30331-31638
MRKDKGFPSASFLLGLVSSFKRKPRTSDGEEDHPWWWGILVRDLLETAISWVVALALACYLGILYLAGTSPATKAIWRCPLVTTNRNNEETPGALDQFQNILKEARHKKEKSENVLTDKELLQVMCSSTEARRWASIAMQQYEHKDSKDSLLMAQLKRIWPQLLELPAPPQNNSKSKHPFEISVVVPAFGEDGSRIQTNLQRALDASQNPQRLQLVLVDAGRNTHMEQATVFAGGKQQWANVKIATYSGGGGRGATLNHGAQHADGRILTFLHSDNLLPEKWDDQILSVLGSDETTTTRVIACAFSFRIHTTNTACPPGMAAAQWLGTIRTKVFHAIYGDSVISMPTTYFSYLGGYPPQAPLMEDYELMDLIRKRVAARKDESLCILPSETLVSPRRWQVNGVPYVILFNFLCVFLYEHRGWSSQKLFEFYYSGR